MWKSIALIGFSGTGKSTIARLLAEQLNWQLIDIDDQIADRFDKSIPEIFAEQGEAEFRQIERELLETAIAQPHTIVATGGGAAAQPGAWTIDLLGNSDVLAVTLEANPKTIIERLTQQQKDEGDATTRPMLAGDDPVARIKELKSKRQQAYDQADITILTDHMMPQAIADEIVPLTTSDVQPSRPAVTLTAPGGVSEIFIQAGTMQHLGKMARERWPKANSAFVITDQNVATHHLDNVEQSVSAEHFSVTPIVVPPGESSKSIAGLQTVYDQILSAGIERGDIVIALGGGVVGDLSGFVAATVLRGVGLVQVPTSLLSMVDSSVGGKTGINHPTGKNLIGSFYQPHLVVIDPNVLQTLPPRELRQGWAEIIKHSIIQPSTPGGQRGDLRQFLERNANALTILNGPAMTYLITRNVALKARVVEADEREAGIRAYLNFGHTLGHAIEASGYQYLHGEAIGLGMIAASRVAAGMDLIETCEADELLQTIAQFGLPTSSSVDPALALTKLQSDKKRSEGRQRWVLQQPTGGVHIRDDVPAEIVQEALESLSQRQLNPA